MNIETLKQIRDKALTELDLERSSVGKSIKEAQIESLNAQIMEASSEK
jgi:hypothetical protein